MDRLGADKRIIRRVDRFSSYQNLVGQIQEKWIQSDPSDMFHPNLLSDELVLAQEKGTLQKQLANMGPLDSKSGWWFHLQIGNDPI